MRKESVLRSKENVGLRKENVLRSNENVGLRKAQIELRKKENVVRSK